MPLSSSGILPHVNASRPSQGTNIRSGDPFHLQLEVPNIVCREVRFARQLQVTDLAIGSDGSIVSASLDRYWRLWYSLQHSLVTAYAEIPAQMSFVGSNLIPLSAWHIRAAK